MAQRFPTYTPSARRGEEGINLVTKIVNDELHWLFRRTHQEHDFGIDGQMDIVGSENEVTGQFVGVQIKHGKSFFQEKDRWGYVYRGEIKHFNYLCNYPAPVIIVLCHPQSEDCYWAAFDPEQATLTDKGWKLTVPFASKLHDSREELLALVGPVRDMVPELRRYRVLNRVFEEVDRITYVIDHKDIVGLSTTNLRAFFDRLRSNRETAYSMQGKVEILFSGYDDDKRELYEIPEVRRYASLIEIAIPELLFFVALDEFASGFKAIVLCLCQGKVTGARPSVGSRARAEFDTELLSQFLIRHWPALNNLTNWLAISEEENKAICYAVMNHLGFEPTDLDNDA